MKNANFLKAGKFASIGNRLLAAIVAIILMVTTITGCGHTEAENTSMETPEWEEEASTEYDIDTTDGYLAEDALEIGAEAAEIIDSRSAQENYFADEDTETNSMVSDCKEEATFYEESNNEEYKASEEGGFKSVEEEPLSTFSADVDTASYANVRRMINDGYSPYQIPEDAVRIEEMINYFDYNYKIEERNELFSVATEIGNCPWNDEAKLMMVGIQTEQVDFSDVEPTNLVFLLDVSGSMCDDDKLPLLQKAFTMLAMNLTGKDRVSIVTYAGSDEIVLKGVNGNEYETIVNAIDDLDAGGRTAGSAGIETAYEIAEEYYISGGNNRVILATDGDLNVGLTSDSDLERLISEKSETGVFLSVLGFGTGNLKDSKMEMLADKGNGNYAYIDCLSEAKKVLGDELGATLVTVAKDVKFQVEFNPEVISSYRLVGYDNRVMKAQDFTDETKDAGEVGAGQSVTALYEIITNEAQRYNDDNGKNGSIDLKYQDKDYVYVESDIETDYGIKASNLDKEWLTINIRYKEPAGSKSKLLEVPVTTETYIRNNSASWVFASAVAEFGMILQNSEYQGGASFHHILKTLKSIDFGGDAYKEEFYNLVARIASTNDY